MNKNLIYLEKGAITGTLLFFSLLFISSMITDNGHIYLYINSINEGWIEAIILIYLTIKSAYHWKTQ